MKNWTRRISKLLFVISLFSIVMGCDLSSHSEETVYYPLQECEEFPKISAITFVGDANDSICLLFQISDNSSKNKYCTYSSEYQNFKGGKKWKFRKVKIYEVFSDGSEKMARTDDITDFDVPNNLTVSDGSDNPDCLELRLTNRYGGSGVYECTFCKKKGSGLSR